VRLIPVIALLSSAALASGSVEGTLTIKRDGKPAFVKNSLVYLRGFKSESSKEPAKMAQTGRAFDKVVLPVVKGGRVQFTNEEPLDTIYHHVFAPGPKVKFASGKYKPIPKGKPFTTEPLTYEGPVTVFCDIHKEMISTVYVVPNDRFVVLSEGEGDSAPFRIEGIPPGSYTLAAWHRSVEKPVELPVEIKEGQTTKVNLVLEGKSGVEQLLLNHKRREEGAYAPLKADGGSPGEAVGLEDKWK